MTLMFYKMMPPGPTGEPTFPMNILADFAGGGLMCALGILLALVERGRSGRGQVVNTDMVTGARFVSTFPLLHSILPSSNLLGVGKTGTNLLDGGAPFYNVYTCNDGGWMSVGCLEPQFFRIFIEKFGGALPKDFKFENDWRPTLAAQQDVQQWPKMRAYFRQGFLTNSRDYWAQVFHGTDACAVPVLTPTEAVKAHGSSMPEFHPRIVRQVQNQPPESPKPFHVENVIIQPGVHTDEVLRGAGVSGAEIKRLALDGALGEEAQKSARVNVKL